MLPRSPYQENGTQYQILNQRGINKTESASDGELSDSLGLTTENYPILTTEKARTALKYRDVTDMYEWNGKLVYVSNGVLYYEDTAIAMVNEERKQFAVVNSYLVVWPDKLMIDLENGIYEHLDAEFTFSVTNVTADGFRASFETPVFPKVTSNPGFTGDYTKAVPLIATYGKDRSAIHYDPLTDTWTLPEPVIKQVFNYGTEYPRLEVGDIVIPADVTDLDIIGLHDGVYYPETQQTQMPETERYNTKGYYGTYHSADGWVEEGYASRRLNFVLYNTDYDNIKISRVYRVGDIVDLSDNAGVLSQKNIKIKSIDDRYNAITFENNIYEAKDIYGRSVYAYGVTEEISAGGITFFQYAVSTGANLFYKVRVSIPRTGLRKGTLIEVTQPREQTDISTGFTANYSNVRMSYNGEIISQSRDCLTTYPEPESIYPPHGFSYILNGVLWPDKLRVKMSRPIPDLDFICESNNRLWGVSNKQENYITDLGESRKVVSRVIFASALGEPYNFFDYSGLSTDGYAVAVGSDEDFTGITSYNDAVIVFKEHELTKILGTFPAEYYTQRHNFEGVQKGCHNSLIVINNVLYYKGVDGVFAYTGGAPSLVSAQLGLEEYDSAVGGGDEQRYTISMRRVSDGQWFVFSYDIMHGLWMISRRSKADAVEVVNNRLHTLEDGIIYREEAEDGEYEWLAEYVPTYETHTTNYSLIGMLNRKDYLRLIIRAEVDGEMTVEYRSDDGPWITARHVSTDWTQVVQVPIPPLRCDKFQFRLSGRGKVKIRAIQRELTIGSTK